MSVKLLSAHAMTGLQESLFAMATAPIAAGQNPPYVEQFCCTLTGNPDARMLAAAWRDLVKRHAALRTAFTTANDGRRVQAVLETRDPHIEILAQTDVAQLAVAEQSTLFDLQKDPLLRIKLIAQAGGDLAMIVTFHHLIMDAFSAPVMIDDVMALYAHHAGVGGPLPQVSPVHPGTLADAQSARRGAAGRAYWQHALQGATVPVLPIIDRDRATGTLGKITRSLGAPLSGALAATAQGLGIGKSAVLHAVWGVMLARITDQPSVAFAAVMANRGHDLAGIDGAIGLFAATLPVRVAIGDDRTFAQICCDVQAQLQAAPMWSAMPLSDIFAAAGLSGAQIDHTMIGRPESLAWADEEALHFDQSGLTLRDYRAHSWDHYDFQIGFTLGQDPFLEARHDTARCPSAGVEQLLAVTCDLLARLLDQMDSPVTDVPICGPAIAQSRIATPRKAHAKPAAAVAAPDPDHIVLADASRSYTAATLENAVTKAAHHLRDMGVRHGDRVAINADQTRRFSRDALACWRRGAAFVPIDPRWPLQRQQAVIDAARPKAVIGLDGLAPTGQPAQDDGTLAYIVFTSGTTGKPKGVAVPHRALGNYCDTVVRRLGLTPDDRALQVTSPAFDLGYTTAFGVLRAGGACHWIGAEAAVDPDRILREMHARAITVVKATPSFLRLLVGAPDPEKFAALTDWRLLVLGGERPDPAVLAVLAARCPHLHVAMHYGPAETTIGCTMTDPCPIDRLITMPPNCIGTPVDGSEIRIIAQDGMTMPAGVRGEIAIGGICVATGYIAPSDAGGFTQIDGQPFYRSGDMGRIDRHGRLRFEGRNGHTFKMRGQRVDPEETRLALLRLTGVSDAAVCLRDLTDGPEMVAFVVTRNRDISALRTRLSAMLTDVQIPQRFVFLSRLLLTGSGKVDQQAMIAAIGHAPQTTPRARPPQTDTEKRLAGLWQDVLGVEHPGCDDDFYALGGHSLRALEIASRHKQTYGAWLPLRWFNDHPKLGDFAAQMDKKDHTAQAPTPLIRLWDRAGAARMLCLPGPMGNSGIFREWLGLLNLDCAVDGVDEHPAFDACTDMDQAAAWVLQQLGPRLGEYRVLIGWSFGADLAHALAKQMHSLGHVPHLVLLDRLAGQAQDDTPLAQRRYWSSVMQILHQTLDEAELSRKEAQFHARHAMQQRYRAAPLAQNPITAVVTAGNQDPLCATAQSSPATRIIHSGGDHFSLFHPPHVTDWTAQIRPVLQEATTK